MKYFLSTLVSLFAVFIMATPAWAGGDSKEKGFNLDFGLFVDQVSLAATGATTSTSNELDYRAELYYDFGVLILGGTYFGDSTATGGSSSSTSSYDWYGPSAGVALDHWRIIGTYILGGGYTVTGSNVTYTASGFAGEISYQFMLSPKVYFAPLVQYYTLGLAPSVGTTKITYNQLTPFLTFGVMF